jgi:hypothetical protein
MTDTDLERRLRRALAARADGVTARDLRPVVVEHYRPRVRWWLPLAAGLAATAVVMLIFVVFHRPAPPDHPVVPAASVPASTPTSPRSAPPVPSPAAASASPALPGLSPTAARASH